MSEPARIFHIALSADNARRDPNQNYHCASLESEGFIHCCSSSQLAGVVSRYFRDVDGVELMIIDVDKLESPLILENTVGGTELFAHIYGPINADCIVDIVPFGIYSTERLGLSE